jgi:hypothetical protein
LIKKARLEITPAKHRRREMRRFGNSAVPA